jgi:YfiR/HmsC-like
LEDIKGSATPPVGETGEFAEEGCVVDFKIESGNLRLHVNVQAAEQPQLHVSSMPLNRAEIVRKWPCE